jgi:hypothetical protein
LKRILFAAFVLLGFASTAHAQVVDPSQFDPTKWIGGSCQLCGVQSWVDIAAPAPGGFLVAGWGVECVSGRAANRVDVFYRGDDGFDHQILGDWQWLGVVERKDAQAYLLPMCPNATSLSGFHVYSQTPIPSGNRLITINVWRGPYYQQHKRPVSIP